MRSQAGAWVTRLWVVGLGNEGKMGLGLSNEVRVVGLGKWGIIASA